MTLNTRALPLKRGGLVSASVLATSLALSAGASAQDQENAQLQTDGRTVDTVIVSARRRSENLQTTPVTVSTFTESRLEERGITSNVDIGNFTPNVVFDNSSQFAGVDTFQAFIRGVGQSDFALNTDPGVGLYVDGVYYARAPGSVIELMDIERVEVLKGPQGTLFGRNSIGGAVNIVTKRPGEEFDFKGAVTFGQRKRLEAGGVVNVPLVADQLFASVAFQLDRQNGYQERIPFVSPTSIGGPSTSAATSIPLDQIIVSDFNNSGDYGAKAGGSARGKLLWTPNENLDVTLSIDHTTRRDAANPTTLVEVDPNFALGGLYNACVAGVPGLPCLSDFLPTGANAGGMRPDLQYTDQFITGDIDTTYGTGANFSNIDSTGYAGTIEWEATDNLTLKSITAYRELDATFGLDIDSSPLVFDQTSFIMQTEQFSQELQAFLEIGSRFDLTAGAFYLKEDGFQSDNVPIAGGLIIAAGGFNHDTETYAFFGEANFRLTDSLGVFFGIRNTHEEKTLLLNQQNLNTDFATLGLNPMDLPRPSDPRFLATDEPFNETFKNTSIRAGANWQITDDVFTYFTYSQGFKSGGFTTRLTTYFSEPIIAAADPNDPNVLRQLDFDEETSDSYELGFKSQLFDNRVRLNAAIFTNTYKDIQIVLQRGVSPSNENVAKARIRGAEIELDAIASDWLSFNATVGYLDAKYKEINPDAAPLLINRFGDMITTATKLPNAPKWTASFATRADFSPSLSGNFNVSYASAIENDVFNTAGLHQDGRALLGASLVYHPSDNWSITAGGLNLTDERYIVSGFEAGSLPFTMASYSPPREWYIRLNYKY